jgi:hypothetical protein
VTGGFGGADETLVRKTDQCSNHNLSEEDLGLSNLAVMSNRIPIPYAFSVAIAYTEGAGLMKD